MTGFSPEQGQTARAAGPGSARPTPTGRALLAHPSDRALNTPQTDGLSKGGAF